MRVPLNWLKDFVEIPLPPEELAHRLTMAGLEVGSVSYIGVEGATLPWDPDKIIIANILEVRPHPNADRLVLADVDYGGAEPHTVVTGAPNLFPYKGEGRLSHPLKSVFAREGARLYDGHKEGWEPVTLKGRPVRGVMSDAMLCSEKELGISDDHEGIMILEDEAPVGVPARDYLGDVVLDIDITPNVARCLSMVGVAREVAALTGATLHIPDPQVQMDGPPVGGRIRVTVEEPLLCPRFTAALVEGVTIGPSPAWMQRRLIHAGMRPINNIVDISNYVMLEWGEPTHAFDADRVKDRHLVARLAKPGEKLLTLDGKERDLNPVGADTGTSIAPPLMVCDPDGPLGIAGVMGGEESEVRETTTNVLLEAAIWEPRQIRRTAQRYKIPSEASRRFERGVDIGVALPAQRRALELMRTLAGGTVGEGIVDVYPTPWEPLMLELPPGEITRIVGIRLSAQDIADILQRLGFTCEVDYQGGMGDMAGYAVGMGLDPAIVRVTVPSFRQDVSCLADLCEEVARVYGYERIPTTRLLDELPAADSHPELEHEQRVRNILVGSGLTEVITASMTSMDAVGRLNPSEADASRYLRITNATAPEREYMQRSLLPALVDLLAMNLRERDQVALFEIGHVFLARSQPTAGAAGAAEADTPSDAWLPDEPRTLGMVMAGQRTPPTWAASQHATHNDMLDFFDIKGCLEVLLERLGLTERASFVPLTDDERFHPGRAAALLIDRPASDTDSDAISPGKGGKGGKGKRGKVAFVSERVGVLGELHPDASERYELLTPRATMAEINLDMLFAQVAGATYRPISRYPATVQDLAVVARTDIPAEQVATTIRRAAGELLESLALFDVYTGPQVGEGNRSLAYRLTFRAQDRTLSDDALAKVRAKIIKQLERELHATIRE